MLVAIRTARGVLGKAAGELFEISRAIRSSYLFLYITT